MQELKAALVGFRLFSFTAKYHFIDFFVRWLGALAHITLLLHITAAIIDFTCSSSTTCASAQQLERAEEFSSEATPLDDSRTE